MVLTFDAKGKTASDEIGNINSGDTHSFDAAKSCIVAVRPGIVVLGKTSVCEEVGEPAPLGFQVEFWEKDFGLDFGFLLCPPHRARMARRTASPTRATTSLAAPGLTIRRKSSRPPCLTSATNISKPSY
jgi:hypothetical protein